VNVAPGVRSRRLRRHGVVCQVTYLSGSFGRPAGAGAGVLAGDGPGEVAAARTDVV